MASLKFEGDIGGLSERQVQFIKEVIEKQGYDNNTVLFDPVGKTGDNYVAMVKRITVIVGEEHDFKMVVKIAPRAEIVRNTMQAATMFRNEIIMYERVLTKFTSLEKSVGIPENERFRYAKCYGCLLEEPDELILLEDLKQRDYTMLDRFVPLESDAVKLAIKNFSKLHSLGFVLKQLEPATFDDYKNSLVDTMALTESAEPLTYMFRQIEDSTLAVIDDETYKKAIRGTVSDYFNIMKRTLKYQNHKHLVIQQGDAWTNNIMFKKEDGKVIDAIMIDYQLSKAGNPACDLHYMIFNCTDHNNRTKNYLEWIDFYHQELDRSLSNFGLKASFIYPRDQLDSDLKIYSKMFFCIAVLLAGTLTRNEEEAALTKDAMKSDDLEALGANISVANLSSESINYFKIKIIDLIRSCRQFGYLA